MRLLDLYPASWRERYGDEFGELLAARPPSLRDRLDIARGALDARLHPQLDAPRVERDWRALAPLAGLGLLVVAFLVMVNAPEVADEFGTYREGMIAAPFWWAAFGLFGAGLAAALDRLPANARVGRWAAVVAIVGGIPFAVAPWSLPFAAVMLAALAVLALAGLRAGWPRLPSLAMAGLALLAVGLVLWMLTQPWFVLRLDPRPGFIVLVCLVAQWPLLALILLRTPRRSVLPVVGSPAEASA